MVYFGFLIYSFIFTFVCIRFFRLIFNANKINIKLKPESILFVFSIICVLIYICSIKVDDISFYKKGFLDYYSSFDIQESIYKIFTYTGLIILISTSVTALVYNTLYKNIKLYYMLSLFLHLLLYFVLTELKIITFDMNEHAFLSILPPIGYGVKFGIAFGICSAYGVDLLIKKFKKTASGNENEKIYKAKNILTAVLFVVVVIIQIRNTIGIYPAYFYEAVIEMQFGKIISKGKRILSNTKGKNESENNIESYDDYKLDKLKDLNFDEIGVGSTVSFGNRYSGMHEDIEWIVLDKKKDEKEVLLLSKNGLGVTHNDLLQNKVVDYKYYSSYDDSDYGYDESSSEEMNYYNSALRFKMYNCYKSFIELNLSKDENKDYNEYDFRDNIVDTYLSDTKTYEKFFPLSRDEYNKYKKIQGVGNFYFKNIGNDLIYQNQFRNMFYTLRTFKTTDNSYNFLCVDTPYDALTFEMNEGILNDRYYIRGNTFWFNDKFISDPTDARYNKKIADDLYHGFVDVVIRPAMWYKCDR